MNGWRYRHPFFVYLDIRKQIIIFATETDNNKHMEAQKLVNRAFELLKDIKNYIVSNEDWIYYFLPPTIQTDSKNYPIKYYVSENVDTWRDNIHLNVLDFNGVSAHVEFTIDDYVEQCTYSRYLILTHFERDVRYNKMAMAGELNDIRIQELTDEISYHKNELTKAEKELNDLIQKQNLAHV